MGVFRGRSALEGTRALLFSVGRVGIVGGLGRRLLERRSALEQQLLPHAVRRFDDQRALLAVQADLPVAHLPEEVDLWPWSPAKREVELVLSQGSLQGLPQRGPGLEEAVGWHQPVDALVGPEVVVVHEVVPEPFARVRQVRRPRTRPEFLVDRPPEPLALAQGLRMVRPRNHVLDALLQEQLLESALAPPGEVLPALVGQDLLRLAKARDAFQQGLDHEVRRLPHREAPGDDVAAVVV